MAIFVWRAINNLIGTVENKQTMVDTTAERQSCEDIFTINARYTNDIYRKIHNFYEYETNRQGWKKKTYTIISFESFLLGFTRCLLSY